MFSYIEIHITEFIWMLIVNVDWKCKCLHRDYAHKELRKVLQGRRKHVPAERITKLISYICICIWYRIHWSHCSLRYFQLNHVLELENSCVHVIHESLKAAAFYFPNTSRAELSTGFVNYLAYDSVIMAVTSRLSRCAWYFGWFESQLHC